MVTFGDRAALLVERLYIIRETIRQEERGTRGVSKYLIKNGIRNKTRRNTCFTRWHRNRNKFRIKGYQHLKKWHDKGKKN